MNIIKTNFPQVQTRNWIPLDLQKVLFIILHHAEAITATPEQINDWHLQNGWNGGAGYNYYIRKDGSVYEMRGNNVGAHCYNYNSTSIGICSEGDYEKEKHMPQVQFDSLVELIKEVKPKLLNFKRIGGHREFYNTSCPGQYFPLNDVITSVNGDCFTMVVQKLKNKGLISTPDYWLQNCKDGCKVEGKYLKDVILSFVAMFKIVDTFEEAVCVMKDMDVVSSPDYWIQCNDGFKADGEYVRKLLGNMAEKL